MNLLKVRDFSGTSYMHINVDHITALMRSHPDTSKTLICILGDEQGFISSDCLDDIVTTLKEIKE